MSSLVRAGSEITVYEDGPYLVRGAYVVRAQDGEELQFMRRTIALCRCGKSRTRPLCDGTHRLIKFRAPSSRELDSGESPGLPSVTSAAPPVAAPVSLGTVLHNVQHAHRCLSESLHRPCAAGDYAQMRLAEPLVTAACSLLRWSVDGTNEVCQPPPGGGETGVDVSRRLVGTALSQAMRLIRNVPNGRAEQIRSLLSDAALALRSDVHNGPPAGRTARREP